MSSRDEKRHRYAALMLAHRQEWQRYAHNQTKLAIRKDKSVVRVAFASTSSPEKAMKKVEAYHKGPSIKVWENVFKAVWLETGHAAAEFMHEYLTGKSANVTTDILTENTQEVKIFVWKDPLVDAVLSSWDSRVADKVMNGGFKDKIEGINSTTQDNIHRTIQEGVDAGNSHYEIGQNIESHLDETWAKRGETISRTETNSAMNAATREDMKATAPDLWKTWSIAGNNTRPWHEEVDGESIPQDEMFIVDGEEMEGPGDDSASPGNVVNCECTQLAEEPPSGTPVSDEEQARIDEATLAEVSGEVPTEFPEGGFKDVESLQAYMNSQYADQNIAFDFKGLDVDALNPAMQQFERIVKDFPYIADNLEYVGGFLGDDVKVLSFDGDAIAQAFGSKTIGLNPEYWSNSERMLKGFAGESETFSAVPKRSSEYIMTHELGHAVEMTLPNELSEDTPIMNKLGEQMYNLLYGNRYPKVSDYARKNLGEQWAESYASLYYNSEKSTMRYPSEMKTLLEETNKLLGYSAPIWGT